MNNEQIDIEIERTQKVLEIRLKMLQGLQEEIDGMYKYIYNLKCQRK